MSNKTLWMLAVASALALIVSACGDKKETAGPSVSPTNSAGPTNIPSVNPENSSIPTSSPSAGPANSPSANPSQAASNASPKTSASASPTAVASPRTTPAASNEPTNNPQVSAFASSTPAAIHTPDPSPVSNAPTISPTAGAAASGAATLKITATNWKFDQERYEVSANKEITIDFKSAQGLHGLKIEGTNINMKETGTARVSLKPGEYKIYCIVLCGPSHGNMVSTIVAK